ncbi:MAG: type II/IV secretion system ATPase subunit [Candidatus Diapherotrites archaeon]|nr:type II/IV secretion system ATPase subunit [Candidatus Diapherotrites archaeon]
MKIGGFEVGNYTLKESGGKKHLLFDCRGCVYSSSVSDDRACRFHVIKVLQEVEADLIVLAEVYERVYNEKQVFFLSEIARLSLRFESENIWSYEHLGDEKKEDESLFGERHNSVVRIAKDLLLFDPIAAYLECIVAVKEEKQRLLQLDESKKSEVYLNTLNYLKKSLEDTEFFSGIKAMLLKLKRVPESIGLYRSFFEVQVKPSFIGSRLLFERTEKLELLDEYSVGAASVQIYSHPSKTENLYFINLPEYTLSPEKYFILSKTKEVVSSYRPGRTSLSSVAQSRKYFERIYQATIRDLAKQQNLSLTTEEVNDLSEIVARYTVGYGVLEILLRDRKITDLYLDAPIGLKPLYLVHSDFGQCQTNILYSESEAESMISKIRAMSGRPFDEAHPVLDFDLPALDTRIAVIGEPLSPDGIAFAFRLHKMTPWTLPQFIDNNYISPMGAGLLSFLIDAQSTMIVTGSRGSGKTSLMGALMLEILQNQRILVQEDTLELPAPYMKDIGFNVQRLKTSAPIGRSEDSTEVSPADALRTALRLGDSALIVGEVRSTEAKVLYEAMRVGAAGNVVMGTIHGDSAYSVWDRVVNDLEVPTTSFKATDIVVVARPIRFSGSMKRNRRVVQITEIKKQWNDDPLREGGLLDLMNYNAKKDSLELLEDNLKDSDLFTKISDLSGLSLKQIWESIRMRAESKDFLVELKNEFSVPDLLEASYTVPANNKLMLLQEKQLEEHGSVDYSEALVQWKQWVKESQLKKLVALKKRKGE